MYPARSSLLDKMSTFLTLSERERSALATLPKNRRVYAEGANIVFEGQSVRAAHIVECGWVSAYKILCDGSRQVLNFLIPGDFLGLFDQFLRRSDQTFQAVTPVVILEVLTADLFVSLCREPALLRAILSTMARDEAMLAEHLVGVGRRPALARTAHLLLELGSRLESVGLGSRTQFKCPLSQLLLADAIGLTAIHLNRMLRQLREMHYLTFRGGAVTFENYQALVDLAGFEPAYLECDNTERPLLRQTA